MIPTVTLDTWQQQTRRALGCGRELPCPIWAGELIDKITILRIKRDTIGDAAKQSNIGREQLTQIRICPELNIAGLSAPGGSTFANQSAPLAGRGRTA
jgi:hypothetical protein